MKFINTMLVTFIFLIGITLGHNLGIHERLKWIQNPPKSTHVHKLKTCFQWETKYKTQLVACVRSK